MSRPSAQGVSRVTINTGPTNSPGLGVFQSLDVRARNEDANADALVRALGLGMEFAAPLIEKNAKAQTEEGVADASLGRINDERLSRSEQYRAGVEAVTIKKTIFDARAEWGEFYTNNVDKTLSAEDVAHEYDAFMKERLGEIAQQNPQAAARMAPEYMQGLQDLVVTHQSNLSKQHLAEAELVMGQEIQQSLATGAELNFAELIDDHYKLTGNIKGTTELAINAVGQYAAETGRPELLQQLPTELTTSDGASHRVAEFSPEARARIAEFHRTAEAKRLQNLSLETALGKSTTEREWIDMLSRDQVIPWGTLMGELERPDPRFTQNEVMAYYAKNKALEQSLQDRIEFGLDPSKPYYMQQGMTDARGKVITRERIQQQVNRDVESIVAQMTAENPELPPAFAMAFAARQVTGTQAYPYEPLKSTFENAPLDDRQTFANVANAFAELPISQRAAYVPDANRRALFEAFLNRRDTLGDERAVEELATSDPDMRRKNLEANRTALREASQRTDKLDIVSSWVPWGDVTIGELGNSQYARRVIDEATELRVGRSGMGAQQAQQAALKDFASTHIVVRSKSGRRAIPRVDGVTESFGDVITWFEEKELSAVGKGHGIEIPEGSRLTIDPSNRDNSALIIVDPTGFPIAPGLLRFSAPALERIYHELNPDGDWARRQMESEKETSRRATLDEYESRTTNPFLFNTR